jgi:hypothetical protein
MILIAVLRKNLWGSESSTSQSTEFGDDISDSVTLNDLKLLDLSHQVSEGSSMVVETSMVHQTDIVKKSLFNNWWTFNNISMNLWL